MVLTWDRTTAPLDSFRESLANGMVQGASGNGVVSGLATTQRGAGANMSVDVAAGAWIAGGVLSAATSTTNVAISASDPTNPRYDLVTADNTGTIAVVTGTAAAAPNTQIPALPANKIPLAVVTVAAGATSISTANCTDGRLFKPTPSVVFLTSDTTVGTLASASASWTALKSYSITAAQAYAERIVVTVQGELQTYDNGSGFASQGYMRVTVGATPGTVAGTQQTMGRLSGLTSQVPCNLHVVLVAGTDYTLGTAFTLNVEAQVVQTGTGSSVTQTYHSSSVVGYIV